MALKKVVDFLILRPVFTKRNFSSLGIVAIFVGVYLALGGRFNAPADLKNPESFGGMPHKQAAEPNRPQPVRPEAALDDNAGNKPQVDNQFRASNQEPSGMPSVLDFRPKTERMNQVSGTVSSSSSSLAPAPHTGDALSELEARLKNMKKPAGAN